MLKSESTCRWCQSDDKDLVRLHVLGLHVMARIQPAGGSQTSSTRYLSSVLDELIALCNRRNIPYSETDQAEEKEQPQVSLNKFLQEARELIVHVSGNTCDCREQGDAYEPAWWPSRWRAPVAQC